MRVRAAVAFAACQPLSIETVDLKGPRVDEGLVEIKATGVSHTDESIRSGDDTEVLSLAILEHNGGVAVEVGARVKWVKPGDHVIPIFTPEWREHV